MWSPFKRKPKQLLPIEEAAKQVKQRYGSLMLSEMKDVLSTEYGEEAAARWYTDYVSAMNAETKTSKELAIAFLHQITGREDFQKAINSPECELP